MRGIGIALQDPDCIPVELPVALVDYEMPVGNTGIVFVAALEAQMASWGPVFSTVSTQAAYRRAGSTLAHMALVTGETFEFLRHALQMTPAQAAAYLGVTLSQIQAWEAGQEVVPTHLWYHMADRVCEVDGREFTPYMTLTEPDFRPRRIRVFPDIPRPSHNMPDPCAC